MKRETSVRLAWTQIGLSIISIPLFVAPLPIGLKVTILGVLSALTWTGTGLGHLAAAWAARDLEESS